MSSRLYYIDIARAICIILVVIGHYYPENSPEWYGTLREIIYCFHMPLFMYVSGFVYTNSRKPVSYKKFILKKADRLVVPYFVISVLIIGIKLIAENNLTVENPVTLSTFYEILYLPSAGYFLWFIYVLFLFFLIIPFFNTEKRLNIVFGLSLLWLLIPVTVTDLFCMAQFKNMFFYFVLGCVMGQNEKMRQKINQIPLLLWIGLFALLYVSLSSSLADFPMIKQVVYLLLAISGIAFITNISQTIEKRSYFLKDVFIKLSLYAYTIYLLHTSFQGLAKAVFVRFSHINDSNSQLIFLLIATIITIIGIVGPIVIHIIYYKLKELLKFSTKSITKI